MESHDRWARDSGFPGVSDISGLDKLENAFSSLELNIPNQSQNNNMYNRNNYGMMGGVNMNPQIMARMNMNPQMMIQNNMRMNNMSMNNMNANMNNMNMGMNNMGMNNMNINNMNKPDPFAGLLNINTNQNNNLRSSQNIVNNNPFAFL